MGRGGKKVESGKWRAWLLGEACSSHASPAYFFSAKKRNHEPHELVVTGRCVNNIVILRFNRRIHCKRRPENGAQSVVQAIDGRKAGKRHKPLAAVCAAVGRGSASGG